MRRGYLILKKNLNCIKKHIKLVTKITTELDILKELNILLRKLVNLYWIFHLKWFLTQIKVALIMNYIL